MTVRRVLAAPDGFKGTLSAHDAARSIGHACWERDLECVEVPMSDGGDGLLDVLGGANKTSVVTGPLGEPVSAPWRLHRGTAVIEMAKASGLVLAGGIEGNRPLDATTLGTGELIDQALDQGARRIIVGLGGSATTDGGFGAIRAISAVARLKQVELLVACDVTTRFTDAATVFGPQKGASPAQIRMLNGRLDRLTQMFRQDFGVDVTEIDGGGAAGGLGGALAALGGRLVPGFELVADELDLYDHVDDVDLIITGEGRFDDTSLEGKVVGGMLSLASSSGVPIVAVVGSADESTVRRVADRMTVVTLTDLFGEDLARREPKHCVEQAIAAILDGHTVPGTV